MCEINGKQMILKMFSQNHIQCLHFCLGASQNKIKFSVETAYEELEVALTISLLSVQSVPYLK